MEEWNSGMMEKWEEGRSGRGEETTGRQREKI